MPVIREKRKKFWLTNECLTREEAIEALEWHSSRRIVHQGPFDRLDTPSPSIYSKKHNQTLLEACNDESLEREGVEQCRGSRQGEFRIQNMKLGIKNENSPIHTCVVTLHFPKSPV